MKDVASPADAIVGHSVLVVGAGMVGICVGLDLLRRGADVTILDRSGPGTETSFGNAGVLARSSLLPLNNPAMLRDLPGLLGNRRSSLRYDIRYVLKNLNWVLPFLSNALPARMARTTQALDALIRLSIPAHKELILQCAQQDLLAERGWLFLYRSKAAFARSKLLRAMLDQFDVANEALDQSELHELEPHLNQIFPQSLWIQDSASVRDPGALVRAYAGQFVAEGGRIERAFASEMTFGDAPGVVLENGTTKTAQHIVLCLGPWGKDMLGKAGFHVPMAFERGYHRHFKGAQAETGGNLETLARPVYDTGGSYVLSPMRQGLRLTTGVELDALDADHNHGQLTSAERAAREAIDLGQPCETPTWLGARPTFPDSRPCIGRLPGTRNVSVAFGHQHIGFATAPGTAQILGDLLEGKTPPIDAAPFRPDRFITRR